MPPRCHHQNHQELLNPRACQSHKPLSASQKPAKAPRASENFPGASRSLQSLPMFHGASDKPHFFEAESRIINSQNGSAKQDSFLVAGGGPLGSVRPPGFTWGGSCSAGSAFDTFGRDVYTHSDYFQYLPDSDLNVFLQPSFAIAHFSKVQGHQL